MEIYDVAIVGGGPAGLAAGIYTSRAQLKTCIIEKAILGGQAATTSWIENYPGVGPIGLSGAEISQKMETQAVHFGAEIIQDIVHTIEPKGKIKRIDLTYHESIHTKTIIYAAGAEPQKLGIPGENEFLGKGVSYCAICDGAFFKGKTIAVIGGGDSALEEALFLTKFASIVYLIHRREEFRAQKIIQQKVRANPHIKIILNTHPVLCSGKQTLDTLQLKHAITGEIENLMTQGIFIYIGMSPNTDLLTNKALMNAHHYLITDKLMHTNIDGVYGAGDVTEKSLRQIVTAVSDGAIAAIEAEKYINTWTELP